MPIPTPEAPLLTVADRAIGVPTAPPWGAKAIE